VIRLHFLHGLPHRKIADLIGVSLPTVKWRCARGKELIRDLLRPGSVPIARLEKNCRGCSREGRPASCAKHAVAKPAFPGRTSPPVPGKSAILRRTAFASLLAMFALLGTAPVRAGEAAAGRAATEAKGPRYARTVAEYAVPDVKLVDQTGRSIGLAELLAADKPVALNFFFASCGSICPVMTSTLAHMRKELGHDGDGLRVVSVTIDPYQDTPGILKAYAKEYAAGKGWSFLTGDAEKIGAVQRAFLADSGGKFNHQLLYFFRAAGSKSWIRVEGLANAADLAGEVRALVPARPTKS
jgi:protein SCO1/2